LGLLQLKLGFNDQVVKFSGTTTLIATTRLEGVSIESIEIRDVNTGVSQKIHWAITTAPSEGVGLGRHIEESVQNSTGENLDPYGSRGGNDTVDVRGKALLHGQACFSRMGSVSNMEINTMTRY
jgi:hypothetical protein